MHIEKIEYGPEKVGFWPNAAFVLIIVLTLVAAGITGNLLWKIIISEPSVASTRAFIEVAGKMLAYLLFIIAAIIYLYVKGLLQDEHVTTLE
ncbi:MAG: hypothetical protein J5U17_00865 [Candidatus Methanoperedens sp.]|nr:hypothetical protein [Candidatus Methanoperedens sp.]MCE8424312.1 hypothetical protein [Candidatus Methanoperedens sp.]MCE8427645.1 hypothetical protein [Candidatus Methanoperedens sp.]